MKDKDKIEDSEFKNLNQENINQEDEDKRRYPPLILLVLLTTFAVLVALGLSFSAVRYLESNETINTIISNIKGEDDKKENYIITYAENVGGHESGINLVNQFPTPDSQGKLFSGDGYVYNFSLIVGKKTVGAYYEITAVPSTTNTLDPKYVKLYLEKNNQGVDMSYNGSKVKVFSEYQESEYNETQGKVIYKGKITEDDVKKGTIDFVMRLWVSEDMVVDNNFNNKTFSVKVNTYARIK